MPDIDITSVANVENLTLDPIKIVELSNIEALRISKVQGIAPVAAHIKEVNHIDPLSIDAVHVTEVRGIEPIAVDQFNVTHLPPVSLSVRHIPAVDLNIRQVPALSLGTHQSFEVPSDYTVRARLLGIEFLRLHLFGRSLILPRPRFRQEQARPAHQSYPALAVAGNPAIPSRCTEESTAVLLPASCGGGHPHAGHPPAGGCLHCGQPAMSFHVPDAGPHPAGGGSVRSGG